MEVNNNNNNNNKTTTTSPLSLSLCRNRLPNCSDDLSHWSDIFCWRQLHYKHLVKAYENGPNAEQVYIIQCILILYYVHHTLYLLCLHVNLHNIYMYSSPLPSPSLPLPLSLSPPLFTTLSLRLIMPW